MRDSQAALVARAYPCFAVSCPFPEDEKPVFASGPNANDFHALEQALRNSEQKLKETQRIAGLGCWDLDLQQNILIWSEEIFHLFEIDKSRFSATYEAFLHAVHPDDREQVHHAYTCSLESRTTYEITHRLLMADGRIKWVCERCISEFDDEGKPVRSIGTVQDITGHYLAQARLNEELERRVSQRTAGLAEAKIEAERASRAKSEFLSRMSHELRTPMNGILGFAQLLAYDPGNTLDAAQLDYVREIIHAGKHLLELVNEVHDLARIERGKQEFMLAEGDETAPVPDIAAMETAKRNARTLLYIEDDLGSLLLVQKSVVSRLGLNMLSAQNAELGVEMARAHRPDVILLDINLPGMDGFAALKCLQGDPATRGIPVFAITANAMERDIKKGLEAGFAEYLTKPVDIIQLVILLHNRVVREVPL